VTFGQPAVGDLESRGEFGRRLGAGCLRVVNLRDEVPQEPPGFHHVGRVQYSDRRGRLRARLGWLDFVENSRGMVGEHVILEYVFLLERLSVEQIKSLHGPDRQE